MRAVATISRRELASLFFSPLAWILLLVALLVNGGLAVLFLGETGGDVNATLEGAATGFLFWTLIVVLPPLLAMRLLSEEARIGTLEFLLTAPVSDAAVVLGKFLAAVCFLALLWSAVLIYGLAIQFLGVAPDWGAVFGNYMGAILTSGLFLAISLAASTTTNTPLLAAFLAFMANLGWLLLPLFARLILSQVRALIGRFAGGLDTAQDWIEGTLVKMDVMRHFQGSFRIGVFDTSEVVFFLTWTAFFLFLTVRRLEARRWRG